MCLKVQTTRQAGTSLTTTTQASSQRSLNQIFLTVFPSKCLSLSAHPWKFSRSKSGVACKFWKKFLAKKELDTRIQKLWKGEVNEMGSWINVRHNWIIYILVRGKNRGMFWIRRSWRILKQQTTQLTISILQLITQSILKPKHCSKALSHFPPSKITLSWTLQSKTFLKRDLYPL